MNKMVAPQQLSLHFEEAFDYEDSFLTHLPAATRAVPTNIKASGTACTVLNLKSFIAERKQSNEDVVYRRILDSVRLI